MKSSKSTSIIVLVVVIASLAASAYFYNQYRTEQKRAAELLGNIPSADPQKEVASLVEKVGKLYQLPTGETPTVATVSDVKKLSGQPFFASAQNGDRVLIYSNAKKAILYRPATNKIIEVGPVNLGPTTDPLITGEGSTASKSATAVSPTVTPVKVAIYNGTSKVGLTRLAENTLKEEEKNVQITDRTNAAITTYEKTLVIDLTGKNKAVAQKYAVMVNGTVAELPQDEEKPKDADLLIILGSDFK
jgi:hypothetical protein